MSDLISRQDAIDAIEKEAEHRMPQWLRDAINAVPSAQKKGEWIPCSERLPDTDDMKLVSCRTKKGVNTVNRAYYSNGYWHGSGSMSGVLAWMPLPETYTEANDD